MAIWARDNHLRVRRGHEHSRVSFVELFFDLVFVFAVTQLSHGLLAHLSLAGLIETAMMFMAVWWAWMYTAWFTNWLNPDRTPVRVLLMALMLAGLALSISIPEAFNDKGLVFAAAYVSIQVGRSAFTLWATHGHSRIHFLNFQRIISWQILAGGFWIAGGLSDGGLRLVLWGAAIVIDCIGPFAGYFVPGIGRSTTADWDVEGAHMAERCGLFIIIALGESILVTGATFAELPMDASHTAAFVVAFVGSVTMWWIYFDTGAERGTERITHSTDPGRLARLAYTYLHIPLVAGIIVAAVADELVLMHPLGHTGLPAVLAILGGPAIYLVGNLLFKRAIAGRWPLSHQAGLLLLFFTALVAQALSPLALSAASTAVLVLVAAWETKSLRGRPKAAQQV